MKNKVIFLISIVIIVISITYLLSWFTDKNKNEKLNHMLKEASKITENNINKQILINPPDDLNDSYWNYINLDFLQIDFTDLLSQNSDTIGWIQVYGTEIDYPIVQSNDNEYYLNHSFDKSINNAGWIYSDYRNNLSNLNPNTVIYGHGRIDSTMFGSLKELLNESWYNDSVNHIIRISTPRENTIWQVFSVYTILKETYYTTTHFMKDETLNKFIDKIVKRSKYEFKTHVDINDKILTLSTCKNDYGNRIVVHAKLIKKEIRS